MCADLPVDGDPKAAADRGLWLSATSVIFDDSEVGDLDLEAARVVSRGAERVNRRELHVPLDTGKLDLVSMPRAIRDLACLTGELVDSPTAPRHSRTRTLERPEDPELSP